MDSGNTPRAEIPAFRLINAVFCEDIRREDNGKDMLLGVYGGDIVVARCPTRVGVSLWLQYFSAPVRAGETGIDLRLRFDGHDEPVSQIGLPFMEEGETTLALRGMPVAIDGSGVAVAGTLPARSGLAGDRAQARDLPRSCGGGVLRRCRRHLSPARITRPRHATRARRSNSPMSTP